MDIKSFVTEKAREAREGARSLAKASSKQKNDALVKMAAALNKHSKDLIKENAKDIDFARKKGLSRAMIDRLTLNDKRICEMSQGLIEVAALPDPVGEILKMRQRPNGMSVGKMRVPIGVIGIIACLQDVTQPQNHPASNGLANLVASFLEDLRPVHRCNLLTHISSL